MAILATPADSAGCATHGNRGILSRIAATGIPRVTAARGRSRSTPTLPCLKTRRCTLSWGVALAYLGRKDDAVQQGRRRVALRRPSEDAVVGAYDQLQLARIYLLVGKLDKALDELEPLVKVPYYLSPAWLQIDPRVRPSSGQCPVRTIACRWMIFTWRRATFAGEASWARNQEHRQTPTSE